MLQHKQGSSVSGTGAHMCCACTRQGQMRQPLRAVQALDAALKKYTIFKMQSDGGSASLVFFVIRERRGKSEATDAEEMAMQASCKV